MDDPNGDGPEYNANTKLPPVEGQPLLDGWEELIDDPSGLSYYFNDTKDETTWERPVAVAVFHLDGGNVDATDELKEPVELTHSSAPSEGNGSDSIAVVEKFGDNSADDVKGADSDADNEHPIKYPLLDVYEEMIDEASGLPYYFNKTANETLWNRPTLPLPDEGKDGITTEEGDVGDAPGGVIDISDEDDPDISGNKDCAAAAHPSAGTLAKFLQGPGDDHHPGGEPWRKVSVWPDQESAHPIHQLDQPPLLMHASQQRGGPIGDALFPAFWRHLLHRFPGAYSPSPTTHGPQGPDYLGYPEVVPTPTTLGPIGPDYFDGSQGKHRHININVSLGYQNRVSLYVVAQPPTPNVAKYSVAYPRPGGTRTTTYISSKALPRPSTLAVQRLPPMSEDPYLLEGFDPRGEPQAATLLPPASTLGLD